MRQRYTQDGGKVYGEWPVPPRERVSGRLKTRSVRALNIVGLC
jgi:hypothetical protein